MTATNDPRASRYASLGALLCLFLSAGCNLATPPQDDPTRYFVLTKPAIAATAPAGELRIGLKTVSLEGYLKHREIVTRSGPNEVQFADYRRWAEPLDVAVSRSLRASLLNGSGIGQVYAEPFPLDQARDLDVSVEIVRCEAEVAPGGHYTASLTALIEVSTAGATPHVVARRLFTAAPAAWDGSDYDKLAGLLSKDVADLGSEVYSVVQAAQAGR